MNKEDGLLVGNYRFFCTFSDEAALPAYKGSIFRGVFGNALKRVVCALRRETCQSCLLSSNCLYAILFEDEQKKEVFSRLAAPPRPYVIEPSTNLETRLSAGDSFDFGLLLFGQFNKSLPYFVYAISQMGKGGIGSKINGRRAKFILDEVRCNNIPVYKSQSGELAGEDFARRLFVDSVKPNQHEATRLKINLETPLRLKFENHLIAELPFHILLRAILRRISSLFSCYAQGEPQLDYTGLVQRARDVAVEDSSLTWFDWKRYSSRQDQTMLMGGMMGTVVYKGSLVEFIPLIEAAAELHIGKQTTFGLGRFSLEKL
jgi:CRISPR/Cas system endoribonuclease Cas6 (RAMP superfamily)